MIIMSQEDEQNPICPSLGIGNALIVSVVLIDICSTFEIISPCHHHLFPFKL